MLLTTLLGCSEASDKPIKKCKSNSAPWEMLLVTNKEWVKTTEGQVFMEAMLKEIPALNQVEPSFKVITVNPSSFGKSFQGFANIVIADFGSDYTKADMKMVHNLYAQPQIVLYITAPTGRELAEYATENVDRIMQVFVEAELLAQQKVLKQHFSTQVLEQAKKQFGAKIYAPQEINAVKEGKNFFWASSDDEDNRLNICMYTIPLTLSGELPLIAIRDSVMKKNIRGYSSNQYMATVGETVITKELNLNGQRVIEIRGLWEMKNDLMGGSFISHAHIDSSKNQILVTEGFVYAPNKAKRKYIRSLEAALRTLKR